MAGQLVVPGLAGVVGRSRLSAPKDALRRFEPTTTHHPPPATRLRPTHGDRLRRSVPNAWPRLHRCIAVATQITDGSSSPVGPATLGYGDYSRLSQYDELMLTYQVRPRVLFPSKPGDKLRFPGRADLEFVLSPDEPFGAGHGPSLTAVQGAGARLNWNANVDRNSVVPSVPLDPLEIDIDSGDLAARLSGNVLTVTSHFRARTELTGLLDAIHFGLPLVMVTEYLDAPVITRTVVRMGDTEFTWQYARSVGKFDATTKEIQEDRFREAWSFLEVLLPSTNRRLFAALHYFHIATRLERVGLNPWEFMAEVLLNLSKSLEVLFPAEANKTIEAARAGLSRLGFTSAEVEKWFVPALALRSNLDVAHVSLATFKPDQLRVLHAYTEEAESRFRLLMRRVIAGVKAETFEVPPYSADGKDRDAERIIRRMERHFPK